MSAARLFACVIVLVAAVACGSTDKPATEPPPSWCPQEADDGSRYYTACGAP